MYDDLSTAGLVAVAEAIRTKQVSAEEVTRACLARIEIAQPKLNCFISLEAEAALDAARAADAALAGGEIKGPLHGVPLAHKDMFYRAGKVSTCGAEIRRHYVPQVTATVIERLQAAGALHFGGLNMSEFASSPTGHNDHFGHCRNPWNTDHITGGSSSGSGAATVARLVFGALGSDTGGSIRLPATMNGVTGIKPTYGRVSRYGAMPLSFSMDHVGPLAPSARDCARLLSVIAGADPNDTTSSGRAVPDYEAGIDRPIKGLRVGVPENYFHDTIPADVHGPVEASLRVLRELGAELVPVEVPEIDICTSIGNVLTRVEAASIHRKWLKTRPQDYSRLIRYRLSIGLALPGTRYVEALNMRGPTLAKVMDAVYGKVDVLHTATLAIAVPSIVESEPNQGNTAYVSNMLSHCTRPINYLGLPSLSLPCGFSDSGLPVGFQIIGRPFAEARLLNIGHLYQSATDWHRRLPPVVPH
jgi:aspartyl-tRNA(Asn)/glutamyl-tRNA(Gln) amidotransferase subunit A